MISVVSRKYRELKFFAIVGFFAITLWGCLASESQYGQPVVKGTPIGFREHSSGKMYRSPVKLRLTEIYAQESTSPGIRPHGISEYLQESQAPRPPDFVNWSLEGAEQRDNGLRGEITLNGWWRWQLGKTAQIPPDSWRWLYRRVPAQSYNKESFPVRDDRFSVVRVNDERVGKEFLNDLPQWCEREFVAPLEWKSRRLVLNVDSLVSESAIYLNNKLLAVLPRFNLGGTYDITNLVRWDRNNTITIFSNGIDGDISLASVPSGPSLNDVWLITSWRQKSVTARMQVDSPKKHPVMIELDVYDGEKITKTLRSLHILRAGTNSIELSEKWSDPIPWSFASPHLYSYCVRMFSEDGALLDESFPARFGFREIWIEDGDFYLNGRPIHFIGHSNPRLNRASELGDPDYIRYLLGLWKKAGINAVTIWYSESYTPTLYRLLDIADEIGIAIFPTAGARLIGEDEPKVSEVLNYYLKKHREYIERYRQHPSILGWIIGVGSHNADFCPAVNDGSYDINVPIATFQHKAIEAKNKALALKKAWAACVKSDDTRPIFGVSNGDIGSVWTSMLYMGFDVDLQARENWPLRWSQKRHKPLMACEFSLPYEKDWFARPHTRRMKIQFNPKGTQPLATEYGAMFFGPSVYPSETVNYLKDIQNSLGKPVRSKVFWEVKKLFGETLRAWRAYGMSFIYHGEVSRFFIGNAPSFPKIARLDPRRYGATPESFDERVLDGSELSDFGQRVRDVTAPLMGFIGGPDGRVTLKDHVYWSGEMVRKVLVLVNDSEDDALMGADWSLEGGDARGAFQILVPAGRQETQHSVIQFQAPAVKRRTEYRLIVSARTSTGESISVSPFALTVFPRGPEQLETNFNFVLFDPAGETTFALKSLGLRCMPMPDRLKPEYCLIIGRRVLEDVNNVHILMRAGFDNAVSGGMKVLIFEQGSQEWTGMLMGMKMKRLDTRRAFIRSLGHPVFEGLSEMDFQYLRGDSNLIEAYPGPDSEPKAEHYPLHFWHWGNDNIVATYTLEKPQVGTVRALLDCGFDLVETPLMEATIGEGLLLFCQVDVTNRIAMDPVSTQLARNLIRYLADFKHGPLPRISPAELLKQNGPRDWIEGYVVPAPNLPGIHAGELFFREKLRLPAFDSGSTVTLFKEVEVQESKRERRSYWITSLSLADLKSDWQMAKRARVEAALRFLNGERSSEGPMMSNFIDAKTLYPHKWSRLSDMDEDFDPYVYWRW